MLATIASAALQKLGANSFFWSSHALYFWLKKMYFCNAAVAAGAAEFYVLVHDVQASGCLGVGSVGISQTFILIFNDDDDDDNDGYHNDGIIIFSLSSSQTVADLDERM